MKENLNWVYILYSSFLFILAQAGAWMQHNLQFKYKNLTPEWWGWYVLGIPITWFFLTATKYGVNGWGSLWANRFVGFSIGMILYAILTQHFFDETITPKILIQILLATSIILVEAFWR